MSIETARQRVAEGAAIVSALGALLDSVPEEHEGDVNSAGLYVGLIGGIRGDLLVWPALFWHLAEVNHVERDAITITRSDKPTPSSRQAVHVSTELGGVTVATVVYEEELGDIGERLGALLIGDGVVA